MCQWCMKHGAGGKWYLNARNYSQELADETNAKDHLTNVYNNFERVFVKKIYGQTMQNIGYKLRMPIIGRVVRSIVERIVHNEGPKRKMIMSDGHFGQVLPVEDVRLILGELAAEPIILNYCMCRYMMRAEKKATCISFGVLSEVLEKLPRYIPEGMKWKIDREEAIGKVEEFVDNGYIPSIWFQPVPYINALCACEDPQCMGIRMRKDFGFNVLYKSEYVIQSNPDLCEGCKSCISMCQFNALNYSPSAKRVAVNQDNCFGCGICRNACPHDALTLVPRENVASVAGHY
jgi:ferredoxin